MTTPPIRQLEMERTDYPAQFWEWLEHNEPTYRAFVDLAKRAKAAGFPRWSPQAILEHIRWRTALRDGYQHSVKINHNAHAEHSQEPAMPHNLCPACRDAAPIAADCSPTGHAAAASLYRRMASLARLQKRYQDAHDYTFQAARLETLIRPSCEDADGTPYFAGNGTTDPAAGRAVAGK